MKDYVTKLNEETLGAYKSRHSLIEEHYGIEQTVLAGSYGYRQIFELVQNGADAILEAREKRQSPDDENRIQVLLRESRLYVANTGAPLSKEGVDALLSSHSSPKRGNQIGRFGLGFKSLLRLGGKIDLFTRMSGAIRFDPKRCMEILEEKFNISKAPGLRLAWPLDDNERTKDVSLAQLSWAETIVRVEVQSPELIEHLRQEIISFPAEFLLFFPVATILSLDDGEKSSRELRVEPEGKDFLLHDGSAKARWRVEKQDVPITDQRALDDATNIHARDSVPLAWAVPIEGKREEAGRFWSFFPTQTSTYLPGILNAPWKLNSDRNAIIGGEWNTALMREASCLVVKTLASLATPEDPARPLDAFPRQLERKDEDAAPLVEAIWIELEKSKVIPDATGTLRFARDLWRHPRENIEVALMWQGIAGYDDLSKMVHPLCQERQRCSRLNALADRIKTQGVEQESCPNLRKRDVASWFESVSSTEIVKAVKSLKLAEVYANDCKPEEWNVVRSQISIIPSEDGQLITANLAIFAPAGESIPNRVPVSQVLCEDNEVKRILSDVMKVKAIDDAVWLSILKESMPSPLRYYWETPSEDKWLSFWSKLRSAPETVLQQFISQNKDQIRVRRRDGSWVLSDEVLLPGELVNSHDASSNKDVLIDSEIFGKDEELLKDIGISDFPDGIINIELNIPKNINYLKPWLEKCREIYKATHNMR